MPQPALARRRFPLAALFALALAAHAPAALAAWPANGLLVDVLHRDGVVPAFYSPLEADGDFLLTIAHGTGRLIHRVDIAANPRPGSPLTLPVANLVDDGGGGMIVFYYSGTDLWAQNYDVTGAIAAGWPAAGLPVSTAPGTQAYPFAVSDGQCGAFVAWPDSRSGMGYADMYAQHVRIGGTVDPAAPDGLRLGPATDYVDRRCTLAPDPTGGFFVAWQPFGLPVRLQRVTSSLTAAWGDGLILPAAADGHARLAPDGTGGVYVAWEDGAAVRLQRFAASGLPATGWPAGGLAIASGADAWPALTGDAFGGAIVAWTSGGLPRALRVTPSGAPSPGWPAGGVPLSTAGGTELALSPDGSGALACFSSGPDLDPDHPYTLRAQRVTMNGALDPAYGAAGRVLRRSSAPPHAPAMLGLGLSDAIVMWWERHPASYPTHDDEVYAMRLSAAPNVSVPEAPEAGALALAAAPNPARGAFTARFALAGGAPATLELLDLAGRRIESHDVSSLGAGPHAVTLAAARKLEPGLYFVRLVERGAARVARIAVAY